MPISITTKPQKKSLFPCLVLCGGLGLMTITARCQPPAPTTESFIESVEQDWKNLRQTTGAQEFLNPQDTITRYQKFYETEGVRSGQTAVEITNIIAQLYWQGLHDPQKALSIYDWGLKNLDHYPHFNILKKGRAVVAEGGKFEDTFKVLQENTNTAPKTADTAKTVTAVTPDTPTKVLLPDTPGTEKVLSVKPPTLPAPNSPSPAGINFRELQLVNSALTIRSGKMTMETFLSNVKPTAKEVLWMLSAKGVIKSWVEDKPLRLALVGFIQQQSPDLLQNPATLSQPAQVALAEYYSSQRSPKAAAIYKTVLAQNIPSGNWFSALRVMTDQSTYYERMGQYDEAAQAQLAIQTIVPTAFYIGNTNLGAARLYMRAGETEKAQEYYKKAEKSTYAWAAGLALVDQGQRLMSQQKYAEAIKMLSKPVSGKYADEVESIKRMMVGDAYLQSGDLLKAKENTQAAIAIYQAIKNPMQGSGVQGVIASAQNRLQRIDQWIKEPIQVDPKEVHIAVDAKQLQKGPIIARVRVRTFRDAPLTVTSDNKNVTAQILPVNELSETDNANANQQSEKEMTIKVTAMPQHGGSKALLTVSSTKHAGFHAQVQVYLEVAGK